MAAVANKNNAAVDSAAALAKHKVNVEKRIFKLQELLLEGEEDTITKDLMIECASLFLPSHYGDVVVERAIADRCGFPLCFKPLPHNVRKTPTKVKYRVSLAQKKVYDVSERLNYCSEECLIASKLYESQLSDVAPHLRSIASTNPPPPLLLQGAITERGPAQPAEMDSAAMTAVVGKEGSIEGYVPLSQRQTTPKSNTQQVQERPKSESKSNNTQPSPPPSIQQHQQQSPLKLKQEERRMLVDKSTEATEPQKEKETDKQKGNGGDGLMERFGGLRISDEAMALKKRMETRPKAQPISFEDVKSLQQQELAARERFAVNKAQSTLATAVVVVNKPANNQQEVRAEEGHVSSNMNTELDSEEEEEESEDETEDDVSGDEMDFWYKPSKVKPKTFSLFIQLWEALSTWCTPATLQFLHPSAASANTSIIDDEKDLWGSHKDDEKEDEDDIVLPVVDSVHTAALKKKLILSTINERLSQLLLRDLRCSGFSIGGVEREIADMVATLYVRDALDAFSSKHWLVVTLLFSEIISNRIPELKAQLHDAEVQRKCEWILFQCGVDPSSEWPVLLSIFKPKLQA
ncbi:RNA polymerase II associated protein 2 [Balamuthia mandrillaris]